MTTRKTTAPVAALSVHEAMTGTTLAATTVTSDGDSCPTLVSFDDKSSVVKQYDAIPKDTVVAAVKPFVQP